MLIAHAGMDLVLAGAGDDELSGGFEDDVFDYTQPQGGGSLGLDSLRDFRSGRDTIEISQGTLVALEAMDEFTRTEPVQLSRQRPIRSTSW
jgi:Ca2+-binding RTX toxin-like protein